MYIYVGLGLGVGIEVCLDFGEFWVENGGFLVLIVRENGWGSVRLILFFLVVFGGGV